jgi:hypothetical protein
MSKTLDLFNKIIAESEEDKQDKKSKNNKKVVDGAEGKPAVIQEDDDITKTDEETSSSDITETDAKNTEVEPETTQAVAVDPTEEEFIKNIIKAAELQAANEAIKSFIKDVSSSLGTNSASYTEFAKTRLSEINEEFKTVVSSIKEAREKILEEAEKAKNKENLISVFDKAVDKAEASEKEDKNEIETIISDSAKK